MNGFAPNALLANAQPLVPMDTDIAPAGIASAEAFGTYPEVFEDPLWYITAYSTDTAEAFGTQSVETVLAPTGIASGEAVGTPKMGDLFPGGIAAADAYGTPSVHEQINPTGIVSAEMFGVTGLGEYAAYLPVSRV